MLRCGKSWSTGARAVLASLALAGALVAGVAGADPLNTMGPKQCAECHESEVEVWKKTSHYSHARKLSRTPAAKSIAKAMGVRRMNVDERCSSCHFTVTQAEGRKARSAGGVSCESCHGPAKNWIEIHGNYGGPTTTRATEPAEHREKRIGATRQAGMHRVEDLYGLTATCYACHVVGDQELVSQGGHPAGGGLDFVAYTQGEMRHNFVRGSRDQNEISNSDRQHQMYVVSRVLALEYALRALANATEDGPYVKRQSSLVKRALAELQQVEKHAPSTEVATAIQSAQGVSLTANQRASALAAAERVQASGRALSAPARAAGLAGISPLLTRPSSRAEP